MPSPSFKYNEHTPFAFKAEEDKAGGKAYKLLYSASDIPNAVEKIKEIKP